MKAENPDIQPKEIRNTLIKNGLCTKDDAPTESSIARKLTAFKREKVAKSKKENHPVTPQPQQQQQHPKHQSPSILHSIDQILGCSNASQSNIENNSTSTSTSAALSSTGKLFLIF